MTSTSIYYIRRICNIIYIYITYSLRLLFDDCNPHIAFFYVNRFLHFSWELPQTCFSDRKLRPYLTCERIFRQVWKSSTFFWNLQKMHFFPFLLFKSYSRHLCSTCFFFWNMYPSWWPNPTKNAGNAEKVEPKGSTPNYKTNSKPCPQEEMLGTWLWPWNPQEGNVRIIFPISFRGPSSSRNGRGKTDTFCRWWVFTWTKPVGKTCKLYIYVY